MGRLQARIRSKHPLVFFLPPFIAGQVVGAVQMAEGFGAVVCTLLLAASLVSKRWRIGILILLTGILSIRITIPSIDTKSFPSNQIVLASVTEHPRFRRVGGVEAALTVLGEIRHTNRGLMAMRSSLSGKVLRCTGIDLPWRNTFKIRRESVFIASIKVRPLNTSLNPFSYDNQLRRKGVYVSCKIIHSTKKLRDGISSPKDRISRLLYYAESKAPNTESGALFVSMIAGTRDILSDTLEFDFKKTGLSHLLVLSGYQISLVFGSTFWIMKMLLLSLRKIRIRLPVLFPSSFAAIFVSGCVTVLSGAEASSVRALIGSLFILLSCMTERGGGLFNGVLVSLLVISILWPGCVLEPGVELTYAALFGILIGSTLNESKLGKYLSVSLYASIGTSIVSLLWFGRFSLSGFLLNPLLAPLVSFISCNGGLGAFLLSETGLDRKGYILSFIVILVSYFVDFVSFLATFDWASWEPEGAECVLMLGAMSTIFSLGIVRILLRFRTRENLDLVEGKAV